MAKTVSQASQHSGQARTMEMHGMAARLAAATSETTPFDLAGRLSSRKY